MFGRCVGSGVDSLALVVRYALACVLACARGERVCAQHARYARGERVCAPLDVSVCGLVRSFMRPMVGFFMREVFCLVL